jgi:hypothetical protein
VVELEKAEDGEVSKEDEKGVQHDDTTLDHQRIVYKGREREKVEERECEIMQDGGD